MDWRLKIHEKTGWSMEVIGYMRSEEEAMIYVRAGLREAVVGGRKALVRDDIDWAAFNCRKEWLNNRFAHPDKWKDYNNTDLIGEGYPPRDENGDEYQLHHIGQHQDSPFAELTYAEHMANGNNPILHPQRESEIDRQQFDNEKSAYWQARFKQFTKEELKKIYNL